MSRTERFTHRAAVVMLAIGLSAACTTDGADSAISSPAAEIPADTGADAVIGSASVPDGGLVTDAPRPDLGRIGTDVIVEMHVTVTSDDIARSVSMITSAASALGGGVAESDISYGDPERSDIGYATIVVEVPPDTVDDLMVGVGRSGSVRSIRQNVEDVTEQLVDLDIRILNARESVDNVRSFMERAEDLTDLVTLEAELTGRQTELERLEARKRDLGERVALSTVTIDIVAESAVDDDSISGAFRSGWDGFVTVLWGAGYTAAVLAPFIVVATVLAVPVTIMMRRRRHDAAQATSDDATRTG